MQIRHFRERPQPQPDWTRQITPFEPMRLKMEPQRHLISDTDCDPKSNLASRKWEQELFIDVSELQWDSINTYIHKGTVNVYAQENTFYNLFKMVQGGTPPSGYIKSPSHSPPNAGDVTRSWVCFYTSSGHAL